MWKQSLCFSFLLAGCTPGVEVCLATLEAKCEKLLACDPDGFAQNFGDQADIAQCVSQVEQDADADNDPDTQTCETQLIERPQKKTFEECVEILPDADCDDFLDNRIEECR
jgi:hypothetical protein